MLTPDLRALDVIKGKKVDFKHTVKIELISKTVTESIEFKNSETHYLKHLEIKNESVFINQSVN